VTRIHISVPGQPAAVIHSNLMTDDPQCLIYNRLNQIYEENDAKVNAAAPRKRPGPGPQRPVVDAAACGTGPGASLSDGLRLAQSRNGWEFLRTGTIQPSTDHIANCNHAMSTLYWAWFNILVDGHSDGRSADDVSVLFG
jgi:hypothetical protein